VAVAVLFWIALSLFLVLDLSASVSLYLPFVAVYGAFWVLAGLLLLYPRPRREKVLILGLFLVALFSVRFVDWNSRKPVLRDLRRVEVGDTLEEAEAIMGGYMRDTNPAEVDGGGRMVAGTVTYRHTTEGWGNSDWGLLTVEGGHVREVRFLAD
jgi:hypothetical protein